MCSPSSTPAMASGRTRYCPASSTRPRIAPPSPAPTTPPGSHPIASPASSASCVKALPTLSREHTSLCTERREQGESSYPAALLKLGRRPRALAGGDLGLSGEVARHRLRRLCDQSRPRCADDDRPPHLGLRQRCRA